jgi:hypothetical protein
MPRPTAPRLALLLCPLLAVAACASQQASSTQNLNDRLQRRLATDTAAGRVIVEPLPDGARVTLVEQVLYPRGGSTMDDQGINVLTHVVQALLDPSLLQITIAGSPSTPEYLKAARTDAIQQQLAPSVLRDAVQPGLVAPESPDAPGPAITIKVVAG